MFRQAAGVKKTIAQQTTLNNHSRHFDLLCKKRPKSRDKLRGAFTPSQLLNKHG